jgi:hypothetical protein
MKCYSIVRIGDDYVVRAEDKNILKLASRRRAAQLITDASELLNAQPQPAGAAQHPATDIVPPIEVPTPAAANSVQELQIESGTG